ncbi:MAG TPA: hypothetical protein VGM91_06615 [Conexibacter sp.]|jgi:hypothetical protein
MGGDATPLVWHGDGEPALGSAEAARMLDVPASALEAWSRRLQFPRDIGGAAGPRFRRSEIVALQEALPLAHSVSGAILVARRRVQA